ncbi:hypothetical protein FA048_16040 [Pedobacter polaris]|uniref:Uncharacterized protein n=1 Tax=Pedobacter polaris TaxID=2571273 RepID=A0A4U1CJ17_9SPHI|nr:hypothetical protein [Pedobacter polaris]TKC06710.1 hypothetical protein FA048_16040 [Pedobacter polaris]
MFILEIKRTDLPSDSEASSVFNWLRIDKETLNITQLTFSSMDSAGEIEERFFNEGYLKFNQTTGTFIEKYNSAQHPLDRRLTWKISTLLSNAIEDFIKQVV